MNPVATALAPAVVVGLAAFLLVGPVVGALGVACGLLLGWSVASTATDVETDSGRTGPAPEFRDARVE
ncbi:hypothetical protein [Halospeciosus flavus]|uniref:Uncharacterized protein n=1 Tax=Halospeciosus flavus TaxID=3032283 RepID=A0ABD5Z8I7_9EURY|nr:hypothetical protein [Halospeciosus flavus]